MSVTPGGLSQGIEAISVGSSGIAGQPNHRPLARVFGESGELAMLLMVGAEHTGRRPAGQNDVG